MHPPNERMQLTWLPGAPIRAGLGSPVRLRATRPRFIRHAADASRWAAPHDKQDERGATKVRIRYELQ